MWQLHARHSLAVVVLLPSGRRLLRPLPLLARQARRHNAYDETALGKPNFSFKKEGPKIVNHIDTNIICNIINKNKNKNLCQQTQSERQSTGQEQEDKYRKVFEELDLDANGSLDEDELQAGLEKMGCEHRTRRAGAVMLCLEGSRLTWRTSLH